MATESVHRVSPAGAETASWYRWDGIELVVTLRIQTRASRDGFGGVQDGHRRLRVTSPPVGGRANAHISKLLAKTFEVPKTRVTLEAGHSSRDKRFRIEKPGAIPPHLGIEL